MFIWLSVPAQMRHLVDRAMRIAKAERTVTCIIVPNDLQELDAVETRRGRMARSIPAPAIRRRGSFRRMQDLRARGGSTQCGKESRDVGWRGRAQATDEVIEVADILGAGIAKALLGKAALPDDLPFVTGSIGLLGTKPSYDMMMDCDTLLMVGTSFPIFRISAQGRSGARRPNRYRRPHAEHPLSDRSQPGR